MLAEPRKGTSCLREAGPERWGVPAKVNINTSLAFSVGDVENKYREGNFLSPEDQLPGAEGWWWVCLPHTPALLHAACCPRTLGRDHQGPDARSSGDGVEGLGLGPSSLRVAWWPCPFLGQAPRPDPPQQGLKQTPGPAPSGGMGAGGGGAVAFPTKAASDAPPVLAI